GGAGPPRAAAWDRLPGLPRHSNQKLSDVARRLVERDLDPDLVLTGAQASPAHPPRPPRAPNRGPPPGHQPPPWHRIQRQPHLQLPTGGASAPAPTRGNRRRV